MYLDALLIYFEWWESYTISRVYGRNISKQLDVRARWYTPFNYTLRKCISDTTLKKDVFDCDKKCYLFLWAYKSRKKNSDFFWHGRLYFQLHIYRVIICIQSLNVYYYFNLWLCAMNSLVIRNVGVRRYFHTNSMFSTCMITRNALLLFPLNRLNNTQKPVTGISRYDLLFDDDGQFFFIADFNDIYLPPTGAERSLFSLVRVIFHRWSVGQANESQLLPGVPGIIW